MGLVVYKEVAPTELRNQVVAAKLKEPEAKERKFEEVVKSAERAAGLVLVY